MTRPGYEYVPERKISMDELNRFRQSCGLKPIEVKDKVCMNCNHSFKSEGPHNRLCGICRVKRSEGLD